jgi:hypothetical protein
MALSSARRQSVLPLLVSLAFVAIGVLLFAYLAITGRASLVLVQPTESRVELEPGGFAVLTARGRRFPVASVRRVIAYKRDLWTTDEICVLLRIRRRRWQAGGVGGVAGVQRPVRRVGEGARDQPGWYMEIMTPPVEPTPRLLFDRAAQPRRPVEAGGG